MKNIKIILCLSICYLITGSAYAQKATISSKFLQEASIVGMNTEALGNLGQKRLENSDIKAYALEVLNTQVAANAQLKALAKKKKVKLADPMTIPINSMQTRVDSNTVDFDKEYIQMIIDDHNKVITLYEGAVKSPDKDIKSYASRYLSIYKKNLEAALKLSKENKNKE